ncbi:MAG: STAS domain-containing protein [Chloroflexota bacterium]|nr:STAS domain-containing protein [Chloroflexota bacterium]
MSERVIGFEDRMEYLDEGREALLVRVNLYTRARLVLDAVLFCLTLFGYLMDIPLDGWVLPALIVVDAALMWIYQALARRWLTVRLTFVRLGLSALWITVGVYSSGGFLGGLIVLYPLIVFVGVLVIGRPRAGYVLAGICTAFYLALTVIEVFGLALPWLAPGDLYTSRGPFSLQTFLSIMVVLILSLFAIAALLDVLIRSVRVQIRARREAQTQMALAQEENAHLRDVVTQQSASLEHLRQMVSEFTAPVIPVTEGVIVMPLVGTLDADRAQQVMRLLLHGVARHRARVAILDLTGLSAVDAVVAGRVVDAARAAWLLGAQVVLVGADAEMAETMADMELDIGELVTRYDLQGGIQYALSVVGKQTVLAA